MQEAHNFKVIRSSRIRPIYNMNIGRYGMDAFIHIVVNINYLSLYFKKDKKGVTEDVATSN